MKRKGMTKNLIYIKQYSYSRLLKLVLKLNVVSVSISYSYFKVTLQLLKLYLMSIGIAFQELILCLVLKYIQILNFILILT